MKRLSLFFISVNVLGSFGFFGLIAAVHAATQCACCPCDQSGQQADSEQVVPPAPKVADGAVVYNPWFGGYVGGYPGNVIPFFSTYPYVNAPYMVFDRPVPPPIPVPPQTAPHASGTHSQVQAQPGTASPCQP